MTKLQAIREEFDEPFRDVVKGFARMGYSRRATREILEIKSKRYFAVVCKAFGLEDCWRPIAELCSTKGRPRPRKYTDEELFAYVRQYPDLPKFKALSPVDHGTIYNRFRGYSWREIVEMAANCSKKG